MEADVLRVDIGVLRVETDVRRRRVDLLGAGPGTGTSGAIWTGKDTSVLEAILVGKISGTSVLSYISKGRKGAKVIIIISENSYLE